LPVTAVNLTQSWSPASWKVWVWGEPSVAMVLARAQTSSSS
jgi:hypothetical protein